MRRNLPRARRLLNELGGGRSPEEQTIQKLLTDESLEPDLRNLALDLLRVREWTALRPQPDAASSE